MDRDKARVLAELDRALGNLIIDFAKALDEAFHKGVVAGVMGMLGVAGFGFVGWLVWRVM